MSLVISAVAALLGVAVLLVLYLRRGQRLEIHRRSRRRILPGGGSVPADLAKDASTDDQRFLM